MGDTPSPFFVLAMILFFLTFIAVPEIVSLIVPARFQVSCDLKPPSATHPADPKNLCTTSAVVASSTPSGAVLIASSRV